LEVPRNTTRKNVMPNGTKYINGMLMGLFSYGGRVGLTVATLRHPNLTKLLIKLIRREIGEFPFTSIQLNYNYASKPHVDRNNLGPSYIVSFGDHSGGQLWVHRPGGETNFFYPSDGEVISAEYRPGNNYLGEDLSVQNAWTKFDGTKLHFTRPFQGERYSLIFFTCDRCCSAEQAVKRKFAEVGFDFDWDEPRLQEMVQEKFQRRQEISDQQAVVKAEERREVRRKHLESRGRCMGRTWGGGWGLRCSAMAAEGSDYCNSHKARDRWQTHGRVDGPVPPAKQEEMTKMQQRLIKQGKLPPNREEEYVTLLVELPEPTPTSSSPSSSSSPTAAAPAPTPDSPHTAAEASQREEDSQGEDLPVQVEADIQAAAAAAAATATCSEEPLVTSPSGAAEPAAAAVETLAFPPENSDVGMEVDSEDMEVQHEDVEIRRQQGVEVGEVSVEEESQLSIEEKVDEEKSHAGIRLSNSANSEWTRRGVLSLSSWGLGLRAWLMGSRRRGGL